MIPLYSEKEEEEVIQLKTYLIIFLCDMIEIFYPSIAPPPLPL